VTAWTGPAAEEKSRALSDRAGFCALREMAAVHLTLIDAPDTRLHCATDGVWRKRAQGALLVVSAGMASLTQERASMWKMRSCCRLPSSCRRVTKADLIPADDSASVGWRDWRLCPCGRRVSRRPNWCPVQPRTRCGVDGLRQALAAQFQPPTHGRFPAGAFLPVDRVTLRRGTSGGRGRCLGAALSVGDALVVQPARRSNGCALGCNRAYCAENGSR